MLGVPSLQTMFGEFTPDMLTNQAKDKGTLESTSKEMFSALTVCNIAFMTLLEVLWAHYGDAFQPVVAEIIEQLRTVSNGVADADLAEEEAVADSMDESKISVDISSGSGASMKNYKISCVGQNTVNWIFHMFTDNFSPLVKLCSPKYDHRLTKDFRNRYLRKRKITDIRANMLSADIMQMVKMHEREMFIAFGNYDKFAKDEFAGVPSDLFDIQPVKDEITNMIRCPPKLLPYFALGTTIYQPENDDNASVMMNILAEKAGTDDDVRWASIREALNGDQIRYQIGHDDLQKTQISITGHRDSTQFRFTETFPLKFPSFFTSTFLIQLLPGEHQKHPYTYEKMRSEIEQAIKKITNNSGAHGSSYALEGEKGDDEYIKWRAVYIVNVFGEASFTFPVHLYVEPRYGVQAYVLIELDVENNIEETKRVLKNQTAPYDKPFSSYGYLPVFLYGPLMFSRLRRINTTVATRKGQGYSRCRFGKTVDMGFKGDAVDDGKEKSFDKKKNSLLTMLVTEELSLVSHLRLPMKSTESLVWDTGRFRVQDTNDKTRERDTRDDSYVLLREIPMDSLRYGDSKLGFASDHEVTLTKDKNDKKEKSKMSTETIDLIDTDIKMTDIKQETNDAITAVHAAYKQAQADAKAKDKKDLIITQNDNVVEIADKDEYFPQSDDPEVTNIYWMSAIINKLFTKNMPDVSQLSVVWHNVFTLYVIGSEYKYEASRLCEYGTEQHEFKKLKEKFGESQEWDNYETTTKILSTFLQTAKSEMNQRLVNQMLEYKKHVYAQLQLSTDIMFTSALGLFLFPSFIPTWSIANQFVFAMCLFLCRKSYDKYITCTNFKPYHEFIIAIYNIISKSHELKFGESVINVTRAIQTTISDDHEDDEFNCFMLALCYQLIVQAGGKIDFKPRSVSFQRETKLFNLQEMLTLSLNATRPFQNHMYETIKNENQIVVFINLVKMVMQNPDFFAHATKSNESTSS